MITSVHQVPTLTYLTAKRSSLILFIITIILLKPFQFAYAQEMDEKSTWSFGFQAGVLSGSLPSVSSTNTIVSRFNVENNYYLTGAFQTGYNISEYESLHLTLSRGEFSIFTEYEFWPDVLFKNQFYTANLSTQLDLRRFIETLPNRLDPYGSFGLGLMSSQNTVAPLHSQGTVQNDYSDDQSNNLSFILTTGVGLDYSLSSRISLFFQFNHNFLSSDIIDKNLAGDVLQNDFIQTTNNWSTFTSGFRLKFGKKTQAQSEPVRDDFQIVSTINSDNLSNLDEEEPDPNRSNTDTSTESDSSGIQTTLTPVLPDSIAETQPSEEITERSEPDNETSTESDSTDIQTTLTPVLPDSTVETQPSEEVTEDEIPQVVPDTELNDITDNYEDDFVFATQPRFGLMGIAVEDISGSFTLNLHSFSDHDVANDIINQLNNEGFRVVTQTANVNGIDYFRVGVGQFESRRDARSAAENLPEQYRNNYFIVQF